MEVQDEEQTTDGCLISDSVRFDESLNAFPSCRQLNSQTRSFRCRGDTKPRTNYERGVESAAKSFHMKRARPERARERVASGLVEYLLTCRLREIVIVSGSLALH